MRTRPATGPGTDPNGEAAESATASPAARRTLVAPTARALPLLGLVLAAINMRPAVVAVGPLAGRIGTSLALSASALGLLTTIPVLCFGLVAPLAPRLVRRFGADAVVAGSLGVLVLGIGLRVLPGFDELISGTLLIGVSVAVLNVLAPALVKRDFATRVGLVTGVYATFLNGSAAVAAAIASPVSSRAGGSWRASLGLWALPACVACLVWGLIAARARRHASHPTAAPTPALRLLRSRRVRHLVGFTAAQSIVFYSVLAWLPDMLRGHGYSADQAGLLVALSTLASAPLALVVPTLAARARSQGRYAAMVAVAGASGFLGLLIAPTAAPVLWMLLIGVSLGGAFPLALMFFALRARDQYETADLSMLSQAIAYLIAAAGPITIGALHDVSGSWSLGLWVLLAATVAELGFGLAASRPGLAIEAT